MPLVGDVIMSGREGIPDMPGVNPPPILATLTAVAGSLGAGTYYIVLTLTNQWGETTVSNELSIAVNGSQGIQVTWAPGAAGDAQGVVKLRIYLGIAPSQENQFLETDLTLTQTFATVAGFIQRPTPTRNTAYLPDSDGQFIGAYSIYRWLNEALNIMAKAAGGIQDTSGVSTIVGQSLYNLAGRWIKIDNIFFDGWEMTRGNRSDIFYRNNTNGICQLSVTTRQAESTLIELYEQPNRTAGSSQVAGSAVNQTDSVVNVNNFNGWVLPFGLAVLGNPASPFGSFGGYEIIAYAAQNGNQLTGVVRGLGGSSPGGSVNGATWPVNTPVAELNVRLVGKRMPITYTVGQSAAVLSIPYGWSDLIYIYIDSKALNVQGDKSGAAKRMGEFRDAAKALGSANRLLQGPVQIGSSVNNEVYNPGLGGGWLLP